MNQTFILLTQVKFHFTAKSISGGDGEDGGIQFGEILDDSRHFEQPVEILIGKQFKMEAWVCNYIHFLIFYFYFIIFLSLGKCYPNNGCRRSSRILCG